MNLLKDNQTILQEKIKHINEVISSEKLAAAEQEKILAKLISLSPKKTGTFLEIFNSSTNTLTKRVNQYHDATAENGNRVEIKGSRLLITEQSGESENLYEQLLNEKRVFASFSQILTHDYDCNIQQVKPGEFDDLHYCLFLKDVILEFQISSADICNNFEEAMLYLREHISLITDTDNKTALELIKKLTQLSAEQLVDFNSRSDIIHQLHRKIKLGYSDKQHKGNVGEGQFHINSTNIGYHLIHHFIKAHTYNEFISVLKCQKKKSSTPKKKS